MDAVAQDGLTVLFSSHLIADLDRVCDYLIILSASQVQVASDIEPLLATHKRLIGPRDREASLAKTHTILQARSSERQSTLLVLVLAYLALPSRQLPIEHEDTQEVTK